MRAEKHTEQSTIVQRVGAARAPWVRRVGALVVVASLVLVTVVAGVAWAEPGSGEASARTTDTTAAPTTTTEAAPTTGTTAAPTTATTAVEAPGTQTTLRSTTSTTTSSGESSSSARTTTTTTLRRLPTGTTGAIGAYVPPSPSPEILERLRQLELLSGTISAKQMEVYRAAIELDAIDEDVARTVEEYNRLVLELEESNQQVSSLEQELALTREELVFATMALEERVVGAYKSDTSALEVLLDTTDMSDFIRRLGLLLTIARSDRERVDELNAARSHADRLLEELSPRIYEATQTTKALEEQKRLIEAKLAQRQEYVDRLSAEIKVLVGQQRQLAGDIAPTGFDVGAYLVGDGNTIVKTAMRYLGVPYVWGGASPAAGFDCSGLVQYVFMQSGLYLPHYSVYQSRLGFEIPADQIQPGDLVFFGNPVHHVGIYAGEDLFIHAPSTGDVVRVSRLSERYGLSHIRRIVIAGDAAQTSVD